MSLEYELSRIAAALEQLAGIENDADGVKLDTPGKVVKRGAKKKTAKKTESKAEPKVEEPEVPTLDELRKVLTELKNPKVAKGFIDEFGEGAKSLSKVPEENRIKILEAAQAAADE